MMIRPTLVTALTTALACLSLAGCTERHTADDNTNPEAAAPPAPGTSVPFHGTYTKYAEATWKDGRPVHVNDSRGTGTLHVDTGTVTYALTYTTRGQQRAVTQVYSFDQEDVTPASGGGYDVALRWKSIAGDTQTYSPDQNKPKLEVRKKESSWQIGLLSTDNNGVIGGVEFK